jgi:hypothetical protein
MKRASCLASGYRLGHLHTTEIISLLEWLNLVVGIVECRVA